MDRSWSHLILEAQAKMSTPSCDRRIDELKGAIKSLLEMPSACTKDEEVLENNRRREIARRILEA